MNDATKRPWSAHILDCPKEKIGEYVQRCVEASGGEDFYFISATHEDGKDVDIAHVGNGPRGNANADLIVRAVNTFDQTREALRELLGQVERLTAERDKAIEVCNIIVNGLAGEKILQLERQLAERDATIARMIQERDGWKDIIVVERRGRLEAGQREQRLRAALKDFVASFERDHVLDGRLVDFPRIEHVRLYRVQKNALAETAPQAEQSPSPQGGDAPNRER